MVAAIGEDGVHFSEWKVVPEEYDGRAWLCSLLLLIGLSKWWACQSEGSTYTVKRTAWREGLRTSRQVKNKVKFCEEIQWILYYVEVDHYSGARRQKNRESLSNARNCCYMHYEQLYMKCHRSSFWKGFESKLVLPGVGVATDAESFFHMNIPSGSV